MPPLSSPSGSVFVTLSLSGRWAITSLTKDWSKDEKQALLNGEGEAWDALRDEAAQRVLADPDEVERDEVRVHAEWVDRKAAIKETR